MSYPYSHAAAFVPRDYLWMYPAVLLALAFIALVACIHHAARHDRKIWSRIGLAFATISASALLTDYFIQLAVVQPSLLKGETAGLTPFLPYNPHGIFLALEDLGYLMMSLALLFTGLAVMGRGRLEHVVRWLFIASGLAAIAALIALSLIFREDLGDKFEMTVIVIDWTVLIVTGVLLSILFRRDARVPFVSAELRI